ncbi:hypothetical protein BUE80_DR003295 [Diplocarpon rosae]|nr:hypothetical protein BUE80_DR003295 [Diplocarpon rosae]
MYISKLSLILSAYSLAVTAHLEDSSPSLQSQETSPNPIRAAYPNDVTGTFNGTLAIVPIDLELARSIIPKEWAINQEAWMSLLPQFSVTKYPLVVRSGVNHDIGKAEPFFGLEDYQSVHIAFPFVDLLGDGFSSFSYVQHRLVASPQGALWDVDSYGTLRVPAKISPTLEAYKTVNQQGGSYSVALHAFTKKFNNFSSPHKETTISYILDHKATDRVTPEELNFLKNVTNQPIFKDGTLCNNQIFLYDTDLSIGDNSPQKVEGKIVLASPLLPGEGDHVKTVSGLTFSAAYRDIHEVPCTQLKGFHFTESSDDAVKAPEAN